MVKTNYEIAKEMFDNDVTDSLEEFTETNCFLSAFGNYFVGITREQIQGLLDGKMYTLGADEYGTVIKLVDKEGV